MGGRKRKLGVERKSQVQQQRQFFAQRREELERKEQLDAGSAKRQQVARFEDARPARHPRQRNLPLPAFGRDLVALEPVKKAASGVIQMHSVAGPIHDFENVNSANVTGLSLATRKSSRPLEPKNLQPRLPELFAGPWKNAVHESLAESEKFPSLRAPYASASKGPVAAVRSGQEEAVGEITGTAGDSDHRPQMHSDYSNVQKGRTPFAEPPIRAQNPEGIPVNSPEQASDFQEAKIMEEIARNACVPSELLRMTARESPQTDEELEYEEARSPVPEPLRAQDVGSSERAPQSDLIRLPTPPVTLPKVAIQRVQLEPDGFNASVEAFEAGLFKISDTEVRAFSRRPVIRENMQSATETKHIGPIPQTSTWGAANEMTVKDDKDKIDVNDVDSLRGQVEDCSEEKPARNAAVDDDIALPKSDAQCLKRTPSPPLFSFPPASNPFTAARKSGPAEPKKPEKSIERCSSFEVKPSKATLPSYSELIHHTSCEADIANRRQPSPKNN